MYKVVNNYEIEIYRVKKEKWGTGSLLCCDSREMRYVYVYTLHVVYIY